MCIKAIIADVHLHLWSQFATTNTVTSVNSRLEMSLSEIARAAADVQARGGKTLIVAGDLFHVRGSVAPEVLNPAMDEFERLIKSGLDVYIIPGNHDLAGKNTTRLGSAVTSLEKVGCKVVDRSYWFTEIKTVMVPWYENIEELKTELLRVATGFTPKELADTDLVIHAPIDAVIPGLPAHGLTDDWLSKLGFKRVFSGHYHNHKDFGNGVFSIGALSHLTWSDPGTKAGYLIVDEKAVNWMKSHAPEFVDLNADMDKMEIEMAADQNFVRVKIKNAKTSEVEEARQWLLDSGAKGVVIHTTKEPVRARVTGTTVAAGASVETSIGEYITKSTNIADEAKSAVTAGALAVLAEVD